MYIYRNKSSQGCPKVVFGLGEGLREGGGGFSSGSRFNLPSTQRVWRILIGFKSNLWAPRGVIFEIWGGFVRGPSVVDDFLIGRRNPKFKKKRDQPSRGR